MSTETSSSPLREGTSPKPETKAGRSELHINKNEAFP